MSSQPYPDMNVIFKGIPKVMQVADDMHRMTNYIEDMRNMFFGCSVITVLGILVFVLLKCMKKQKRRGRRFIHHVDSEQSSISRNGAGGGGGHYRHFSRHLSNGDWAHKIVDMSDQGNPAQTTSTTNTGTIGTVSRHTPPIHNRYGVAHNSSVHPSHLPPQTAHQPMGHPQQGQQQQQQQTLQDYQSSSQHSALSGNFVANGNGGGGGGALGMKRLDPVKLTVDEVPYADSL